MASSFLSSPPFLSSPIKRLHLSSQCSQPPTPRPSQPLSQPQPNDSSPQQLSQPPTPSTFKTPQSADSTDWIASGLSRRFGIGAGLAWVGFLATGVVSEQVKTRFEAYQQEADTRDVENEREVLFPNGIRYYEIRTGGGSSPRQGDLVVIDLQGKLKDSSEVFVDTFSEGERPLALVLGSRPYTMGMCEGIEYVLKQMRAGGKARVIIPPALGFGDKGVDLGDGVQVPPSSSLEFVVQVDKVSIAPV